MVENGDSALLRTLNRLVTDLLEWLGHYPDDQVSPAALATIRDAVDWTLQRLPAEQRHRLEELAVADPPPTSDLDTALLRVVIGLLIDVVWWLETCSDDEVDPDDAVKLLESVGAVIVGLPDQLSRRLLQVVEELAVAEPFAARRDQLTFFPFATGMVEEEPVDGPPHDVWVHPAARLAIDGPS
jgi:hypothetical protein